MSEDQQQPSLTQTPEQKAVLDDSVSLSSPLPRPGKRPSRVTRRISIALAILLVAGGLGFVIYTAIGQFSQQSSWAAARSQLYHNATVGAEMMATARPLATMQARIFATATAQDAATATAGDEATEKAQEMSALLTQKTTGAPALDDPMSDNSLNNQWSIGYADNNGTGCNFVDGRYRAQEALQGFLNPCFAEATKFDNFVYQVSLTITSGNQGGILFRGNKATGKYYLFRIDISGAYALDLYNGKQSYTLLASGISPAIVPGHGQVNNLTVMANQGTLYLFVNQVFVMVANDTTLKVGQIGVAAINNGLPSKVDFSNAKVWKLS